MTFYVPELALRKYDKHFRDVSLWIPNREFSEIQMLRDIRFSFICFTNRCGSNFVAEALASDGRLNLGMEFCNGDEVSRVIHELRLSSFYQYFVGVALNDQISGRFVSKLGVEHLTVLYKAGILQDLLPQSEFIFVERLDTLGQAVSLAIAEQTQQWASYNAEHLSHSLEYDGSRIGELISMIIEQNQLFELFFARNRLSPIRIVYEHFIENPDQFTRYIGDMLGIDQLRVVLSNIRTSRQAGSLNREWCDRYAVGHKKQRTDELD